MTQQHDSVPTFGRMLAVAGAVTAAMGQQVIIGFVAGVFTALIAEAIAGTDFN